MTDLQGSVLSFLGQTSLQKFDDLPKVIGVQS